MNRIIWFVFSVLLTLSANAQIVTYSGLGRTVVENDALKGPVLDSTATHPEDTTSSTRGTGGYTLFDFGVRIQPDSNFRAGIILRTRNEFGGFFGNGISLAIRQVNIGGIIAKKVKFELGDLDLGMTPYTLYNPDEIYHDYEADIFAMRRNIVHYENFNYGNNWRVQAINLNSKIVFNKIIEKITLRVLGGRNKKLNITTNTPDRLFYGGRIGIVQSKSFEVGFNSLNLSDLVGTVADTAVIFKNNVFTGDLKLNIDFDNITLGLFGEAGTSAYNSYIRAVDSANVKHADYFMDGGVSTLVKSIGLKVKVSYRNVGPEFFNPMSQTNRINVYNNPSLFGSLQNLNDPVTGNTRVQTLYDRYSQEALYNATFQTTLMAFLPQYNNVTPYGPSTPNRKGFTIGIEKSDSNSIVEASVQANILSEIVGETTSEKRNFLSMQGGVKWNLNRMIKVKRAISIELGARYENTKRNVSVINFTSLLLDAGLSVEAFKDFHLLGGYKILSASGNEYLSQRNQFNDIVNIPLAVNMNETQGIIAVGMKYNLSKSAFFTTQYHILDYNNKKANTYNYKISQLFFNFTLMF